MIRLSRRDFLRRSGQAAFGIGVASQLGWLVGCGSDSEPAWNDLSSDLQGALLRPDDAAYAQSGLPWNLAFADIRPQGIAQCASPLDVQTALRWARDNDMPAVPICGGHDYAGFSTTEGLLVDLANMNSFTIDPATNIATIGAGALLGAVESISSSQNLVVPAGRCANVGISGFILGGGFGFNARRYGITSDNLIRTQIVTADGELLICDENEHPDLFWALRGGGGGNFGINVEYQVQAYPVTTASVYKLEWNPDDAAVAWAAMQDIAMEAPNEFSLRLGVCMSEDGPSSGSTNESIQTIGQYLGPPDELEALLAPAFNAAQPLSSTIEEMSIADATTFLGEDPDPMAFLGKSTYLAQPLPESGIATMLEWMRKWPAESNTSEFVIFTWGGMMNSVPPDATAFVHRSAAFVVETCAAWHPDDSQSIIDASTDWIEGLYEAMQPYFTNRAYQNFADRTREDWQEAYYGENFSRLVEVKQAYDPDNFFNFQQSIPTEV